MVDQGKAQKEAHDLHAAGEKKWGTEESTFNTILGTRSFAQLRATFEEYAKVSVSEWYNGLGYKSRWKK